MKNIKKQTLAKQAANEIFVRDNFGRTSMGLRVETELGDVIAYPNENPDYPGISVVFRQKGKDVTIDLALIEVPHDGPSNETIDVYCFEDVSTVEWTRKFSIRNQDVTDAREKN